MPQFSAFAPFSMLDFSSKPTHLEAVYGSISDNVRGAYDLTPGTHTEASVYARACAVADGLYALDRANNQRDPLKCIEMLPGLERDYGIVPPATATLLERQQAVAAKMLLSNASSLVNLGNALRAELGSDFIAVRPFTAADRTLSASTPVGNFTDVNLPIKQITILDPVPVGTCTVRYQTADTSAPPVTLLKNDSLIVQPDNSGLREVVTVSAVASGTFTATFTKGHDTGCMASTQNFPGWWSTQCMLLVILKAAAEIDTNKQQIVHQLMQAATRGVVTWSIVAPSSPGALSLGPFTLGDATLGQLGPVPIGTLSFTPSP